MTIWLCDRCGAQVKKDSYGAGKYEISKPCKDENGVIYIRTKQKNYFETVT